MKRVFVSWVKHVASKVLSSEISALYRYSRHLERWCFFFTFSTSHFSIGVTSVLQKTWNTYILEVPDFIPAFNNFRAARVVLLSTSPYEIKALPMVEVVCSVEKTHNKQWLFGLHMLYFNVTIVLPVFTSVFLGKPYASN